jgi:hypothetical protein
MNLKLFDFLLLEPAPSPLPVTRLPYRSRLQILVYVLTIKIFSLIFFPEEATLALTPSRAVTAVMAEQDATRRDGRPHRAIVGT